MQAAALALSAASTLAVAVSLLLLIRQTKSLQAQTATLIDSLHVQRLTEAQSRFFEISSVMVEQPSQRRLVSSAPRFVLTAGIRVAYLCGIGSNEV